MNQEGDFDIPPLGEGSANELTWPSSDETWPLGLTADLYESGTALPGLPQTQQGMDNWPTGPFQHRYDPPQQLGPAKVHDTEDASIGQPPDASEPGIQDWNSWLASVDFEEWAREYGDAPAGELANTISQSKSQEDGVEALDTVSVEEATKHQAVGSVAAEKFPGRRKDRSNRPSLDTSQHPNNSSANLESDNESSDESDLGDDQELSGPMLSSATSRGPLEKQCEHDPKCTRTAKRVPGKYDGQKLCARHGTQWEANNSKSPKWEPIVVPLNLAIARIRPNVAPLPYQGEGSYDQSLVDNRSKFHGWTARFHQAAMKTYIGEAEDGKDLHTLLNYQKIFNGKAIRCSKREYVEEKICTRISLLFPIALHYHAGGPAIYGIGGDNSGYQEDKSSSFIARLKLIEKVLQKNKRVVMDVIEGRGVEAFVRGPGKYDKRKRTNKTGNVKRQLRSAGAEASTAGPSRRPSVQEDDLDEVGDHHDEDDATADDVGTVRASNPRKRKRPNRAGTRCQTSDQVPSTRKPVPKRSKTAPSKRFFAQNQPACADVFGQSLEPGVLFSGATVEDGKVIVQPHEVTCEQQPPMDGSFLGTASPHNNAGSFEFSSGPYGYNPWHQSYEDGTGIQQSPPTEYQRALADGMLAAQSVHTSSPQSSSSVHQTPAARVPPMSMQPQLPSSVEHGAGRVLGGSSEVLRRHWRSYYPGGRGL